MANEPVIKKIVRDVVREEIAPVKKDLLERMDIKFLDFEEKIIGSVKSPLTDLRSDMARMQLQILSELETIREEHIISSGKIRQINELGDRVDKIEKIHPQNTHVHQFASA